MRKAVITGMGLMSILGIDKNAHQMIFRSEENLQQDFSNYWDNYLIGEAGRIPKFDPKKYIKNPKSIKFMSRQTILGCAVTAQAIQDAMLSEEELKKTDYQNALIFGAGVSDSIFPLLPAIVGCIDGDGSIDYQRVGNEGYRNLPPLWILEKLPNTTVGQISAQNSIRGLNYTVVNGPLNGILSIAQGMELIENMRTSFVICGAAEGFGHADYIFKLEEKKLLSLSDKGLMPFDKGSDGCYITEGASAFVVEDEQTALKRGAKIYARILSAHNSYLPYFSNSGPEYAAQRFEKCMQSALESAGISLDEIDLIQANACGVQKIDLPEAMAIKNLFGNKVPVTSCAPYAGYTIGTSGTVSVAYALLQMEHNYILPIGRTDNFYYQEELDYVKSDLQQHDIKYILVNSFTDLGDACTIILARGGV